jgi:hypothetical protein
MVYRWTFRAGRGLYLSNSRMQITSLSSLFKKINIIKKGININNTLKLYAVLFSCFIYAKGQRPSGFKANIKSIFKTNLPSLMSAPFFSRLFRPFFTRKLLKFTKSCKNWSKNEIYLQEIYQSSNQEIFAISLSSCSRYNANFKLDQSVSAIHDSPPYFWDQWGSPPTQHPNIVGERPR